MKNTSILLIIALLMVGCNSTSVSEQSPSIITTPGLVGAAYKGNAEITKPAHPSASNPIKINTKPVSAVHQAGRVVLQWAMYLGAILVAVGVAGFFTSWIGKELAIELAVVGGSFVALALFWQWFISLIGIILGIVLARWVTRHQATVKRILSFWRKPNV